MKPLVKAVDVGFTDARPKNKKNRALTMSGNF